MREADVENGATATLLPFPKRRMKGYRPPPLGWSRNGLPDGVSYLRKPRPVPPPEPLPPLALLVLAIVAEIEAGKAPNVVHRLGKMARKTASDADVQANIRWAIELLFAKGGRM
jgi:hypothetical protein